VKAYYDARAPEYDEWYYGAGRFTDDRPGWKAELSALSAALATLPPARTLDVACGTGFLTRHIRGEVTLLDQSAGRLEIASVRISGAVAVVADALAPLPSPDRSFDRVLTGHFYGHLEPAARARFLAEARRLAPELIVVDSALREGVEPESVQERTLNDGTRWTVYKRYFTAQRLLAELGGGRVLQDGRWFLAVASG
jgi:ubiquinone/menaquinone biosynthesis C-methylase UbiE